MATEGKPFGWTPKDEREHYFRCPVCGELLDMRDLSQVLDHLHGQNVGADGSVNYSSPQNQLRELDLSKGMGFPPKTPSARNSHL